jgi:hypothetical protein
MNIPESLQESLKKNKKQILAIFASPARVTDLKDLGTFNNFLKIFYYTDDERNRKSVDYHEIEELLDSDDETFNIADMYSGKVQVPDVATETDPLNSKKNKPCFCLPM